MVINTLHNHNKDYSFSFENLQVLQFKCLWGNLCSNNNNNNNTKQYQIAKLKKNNAYFQIASAQKNIFPSEKSPLQGSGKDNLNVIANSAPGASKFAAQYGPT